MPVINVDQELAAYQARQQQINPNGWIVDARGIPVPPNQAEYLAAYGNGPGIGYFGIWAPNPQYDPKWTPAANSSQFSTQFNFDTIGQTIPRSIGHVPLPMRLIWVLGVEQSGAEITVPTFTAAWALCRPIDPTEEGIVAAIFSGGQTIYDPNQGGVVIPDGMDDATATALKDALEASVIYPGDENQEPAPLIVSDKGEQTPAFRGLRYIIIPGMPVSQSQLSMQWNRSNSIPAVEFAAGFN